MRDLHARRWIAGAAIAALALIAVRVHPHAHVIRLGDRLTPLRVDALGGGIASLQATGRPQIINIFATWCPPCNAEMPQFARFAQAAAARGISVIGVDQQEDSGSVARFAARFGLRFPLYIDSSNVTHDVLGARMIPTTIFVDKSGVVRWERNGPLTARDYRDLVAAVERNG